MIILSVNVGPHTARARIGDLARGNYLCVTDDDILFHPGWLHKMMDVLHTFPSVGSVSGSPQRTAFQWGCKSNAPKPGISQEVGRLIPAQWESDFALSIGRNPANHAMMTLNMQDTLLACNGVKAWGHGHHMQMFGYRDILRQSFFESDYLLDAGGTRAGHGYNIALDELGYMNLTTHERTALHIGNILDDRTCEIMREWGIA